MQNSIKVAVLGSTGYVGLELINILSKYSDIELKFLGSQNITNKDIANHLNLPPVKLHCSMLAEDAIKEALKDFNNKNA